MAGKLAGGDYRISRGCDKKRTADVVVWLDHTQAKKEVVQLGSTCYVHFFCFVVFMARLDGREMNDGPID